MITVKPWLAWASYGALKYYGKKIREYSSVCVCVCVCVLQGQCLSFGPSVNTENGVFYNRIRVLLSIYMYLNHFEVAIKSMLVNKSLRMLNYLLANVFLAEISSEIYLILF